MSECFTCYAVHWPVNKNIDYEGTKIEMSHVNSFTMARGETELFEGKDDAEIQEIKEIIRLAILRFKDAVYEETNDSMTIQIGVFNVLISGGMTNGSFPTKTFEAISFLADSEILDDWGVSY